MERLRRLIERVRNLLPSKELEVIDEYYEYDEFGLAVEHIATRLHDLYIPIDQALVDEIAAVCSSMDLGPDSWQFLDELVDAEPREADEVTDASAEVEVVSQIDAALIAGAESIEDLVRIHQAGKLDRLSLIRAVRQRFGLGLEEAVEEIASLEQDKP